MNKIIILCRNADGAKVKKHYKKGEFPLPVYETIYNFNKRQLEAELEDRNDGLKNYVWDVEHIYDLTKEKDRQDYIKYCIDCFYDKDCRDGHSKLMGAKFVSNLDRYIEQDLEQIKTPPISKK